MSDEIKNLRRIELIYNHLMWFVFFSYSVMFIEVGSCVSHLSTSYY